MKRIFTILAILLPILCFGQTHKYENPSVEDASIELWNDGWTLMFNHEEDDAFCGMYFFPSNESRPNMKEAFVVIEIMVYSSNSKKTEYVFKPVVEGNKVHLYTEDGQNFGHAIFHNNCMYLYHPNGEFNFKLERKY